jgi:hypothetical protein
MKSQDLLILDLIYSITLASLPIIIMSSYIYMTSRMISLPMLLTYKLEYEGLCWNPYSSKYVSILMYHAPSAYFKPSKSFFRLHTRCSFLGT